MLHNKVFMHGESKLYTVNLHSVSRSTIGFKNLLALVTPGLKKAEVE